MAGQLVERSIDRGVCLRREIKRDIEGENWDKKRRYISFPFALSFDRTWHALGCLTGLGVVSVSFVVYACVCVRARVCVSEKDER